MSKETDKPVVIDADFVVQYSDGEIQSHRQGFLVDAKTEKQVLNVTKSVVKQGFYGILWCLRQVAGLVVEGLSGTVDGVKEASELESKYDNKNRYVGHGSTKVSRRAKRPIWDIPTKEEEDMERRMRYG